MGISFRQLESQLSQAMNTNLRPCQPRSWSVSPLLLLLLSPLICLLTLLFRTLPPAPVTVQQAHFIAPLNSTSALDASSYNTSLTRCILYDRPPHTASTTIAEALTACLALRDYTATPRPYDLIPEDDVVANLIAQPGGHRSATLKHIQVSADDIIALRAQCPYLLYVTSTRPMPDRILSSAKYVQTEGHGDSNLTHVQVEQAMRVALGDKNNERRLEHYPFSSDMRLLPHYIVRHDSFREDFSALLEALQCDPQFPTMNVHKYGSAADEELERATRENITLLYGDARHFHMMALAAERNKKGLRRARLF